MLHPLLSRISIALIMMLFMNHCLLYCMKDNSFHLFDDRLEQEFQKKLVKKVIKHVDDMSYIGQASKACYAEVKRQQIHYIAKMHRLQDPSLIRVNIPPFVYIDQWNRGSCRGRYAIDPNSRIFYKESIIETWPLSSAVVNFERMPLCTGHDNNKFHVGFADTDKYERKRPTNLLIACFEQDEYEAQRLVRFYPLAEEHIIPGNPQSEKLYRDPFTPGLFREALCASKMIPGNKATQALLAHLAVIGFTEETWIEAKRLKKEEELRKRQEITAQARHLERFLNLLAAADLPVMEFTPEEEERARKDFEEMILSATGPRDHFAQNADETNEKYDTTSEWFNRPRSNELFSFPQMKYASISSESSNEESD